MHRGSLWDETSRAEAVGLVLAEKQTCPRCGNPASIVEVDWNAKGREDGQPVSVWRQMFESLADRSGRKRKYVVTRLRCDSCAALELIRRNAVDAEPEPVPYKASPADGAFFVAEPYHPEP